MKYSNDVISRYANLFTYIFRFPLNFILCFLSHGWLKEAFYKTSEGCMRAVDESANGKSGTLLLLLCNLLDKSLNLPKFTISEPSHAESQSTDVSAVRPGLSQRLDVKACECMVV